MSEQQQTTPATTATTDPAATTETAKTEQTSATTQTSSTETTKETTKPSLLNEGEKTEKTEEKVAGAPEKYEAFKAPEGFEIDEEVATQAGAIFKELNLTQEQGQKLVDFYTKLTQEAVEGPMNAWVDQQEAWQKEIKEDKDLGGKLPEVKATIRKFVDAAAGDQATADAFREAMDFTGAGNNPAFIRLFYKIASKYTEGAHVAPGKPTTESQTQPGKPGGPGAHALYPTLPSTAS